MPKPRRRYRRVLLKLSGEVFGGKRETGIDASNLKRIVGEIKKATTTGAQIAIVVGGGNIFRGATGAGNGIDRTTGDYMGMLATVINALALQDALEHVGIPSRVQSAIEMRQVAEPYIRRRAIRHLEKGRIIIFGAGTGNPYFSTDTAAALRAAEIDANVMLKATKVDGVFDKDPMKHKNARKYSKIGYMELVRNRLKIMDSTAATLCMDNGIPTIVFDLMKTGNIYSAIVGKPTGTLVYNKG